MGVADPLQLTAPRHLVSEELERAPQKCAVEKREELYQHSGGRQRQMHHINIRGRKRQKGREGGNERDRERQRKRE